MHFERFLHVNIRCAPDDIPAIERFYADVVGLTVGFRPNFSFPGTWLYAGEDAIIHVQARYPQGSFVKDRHNGSVDHVAWKTSGAARFRAHLVELGVEFDEQNVPEAGYQVFLYDPVGTKLEFNFMGEQVENAVAAGTEIKMR